MLATIFRLLCLPFLLVLVCGNGWSADDKLVLPKDLTVKEKSDLSALRKKVDTAKEALEKKRSGLVSYFSLEYPDIAARLDKAGLPSGPVGVPGGTKFQPGAGSGRDMQELQRAAAKQKTVHAEVHKILEPKFKVVKAEVEKRIREAEEKIKKPLSETDKKKIRKELSDKYVEENLTLCEKAADDDYRKEKKALEEKLASAEKELRARKEAIIKAHPSEKSK